MTVERRRSLPRSAGHRHCLSALIAFGWITAHSKSQPPPKTSGILPEEYPCRNVQRSPQLGGEQLHHYIYMSIWSATLT